MDDIERLKLRREQNQRELEHIFGLGREFWAKYSLKSFEVLPENELAFRTSLEYMMIPPDLKFPADDDTAAWDNYSQWIESLPAYHHFLTLVGGCGRGKTHVALGLAIWAVTELQQRVVYWQVPDFLNTLRHSFEDDNGPSYSQIMSRCKSVDLLVLDDLGMQRNSDWAIEQLDSLIDHRYVEGGQTIFTTNLTPAKLPKRIASRIREGEIVMLAGADYREVIAERRLAAREATAEAEKIITGVNNDRL